MTAAINPQVLQNFLRSRRSVIVRSDADDASATVGDADDALTTVGDADDASATVDDASSDVSAALMEAATVEATPTTVDDASDAGSDVPGEEGDAGDAGEATLGEPTAAEATPTSVIAVARGARAVLDQGGDPMLMPALIALGRELEDCFLDWALVTLTVADARDLETIDAYLELYVDSEMWGSAIAAAGLGGDRDRPHAHLLVEAAQVDVIRKHWASVGKVHVKPADPTAADLMHVAAYVADHATARGAQPFASGLCEEPWRRFASTLRRAGGGSSEHAFVHAEAPGSGFANPSHPGPGADALPAATCGECGAPRKPRSRKPLCGSCLKKKRDARHRARRKKEAST